MKKQKVKLYLTLDREFYELLSKKAQGDFAKTATWTKQYLMKALLGDNKTEVKLLNYHESM